jgi:predicted transcriptional regulator
MDIKASLDRVLTWPPERQRDAAQMLETMEKMEQSPLHWDDGQLVGIAEAIAGADRGEFLTADEVETLWKKWGA